MLRWSLSICLAGEDNNRAVAISERIALAFEAVLGKTQRTEF